MCDVEIRTWPIPAFAKAIADAIRMSRNRAGENFRSMVFPPICRRLRRSGAYERNASSEISPHSSANCNRDLARSQPQIEFADQLVVVELVGGAAFEGDLAMHDNIAAISDAHGLIEILLGHQH